MSQSRETTRPDPLLDAYRQASEREAARPGANVRAAVLAHARVVAQSSGDAARAAGVAEITRATPAANDAKPIWRLAAGVVLGLVGVWIFQLTRPAAAPDPTVAAATAPATAQADKARDTEPSVAAPTPSAASPAPTAPPAAPPAAPEASVAVATAPIAKDNAARPPRAERERLPEAMRSEQNLVMAKAPVPPEKTDRPSAFAGAATAALPSAADAAASAMGSEVVIASAETRKSLKAPTRTEPASTAPTMSASPSAAAPNPFPAEVSEAGAAAPQKSNQVANRARAAPISDLDVAMFRAVRAGDIPGLRVAISRGANVNGNDERGRTALQIARERADIETIKVLETAGARP